MELIESVDYDAFETSTSNSDGDRGWVYQKQRSRKQNPVPNGKRGNQANCYNVFSVLMLPSDGEEDKSNVAAKETENLIVSLHEAAAMIDPSHLESFLTQVMDDYASLPKMQLLKFTNYFETALSKVSFSWVEMFKESPLSTLTDFPLSHIPELVYETSVDWIKQRPIPIRTLGAFVLFAFDCILTDLAPQHTSSKSQLAKFVALAMVLRTRPDALTTVLPLLSETPMYQGPDEDKLPVIVWMMAQASHGDLSAGLYSWAHYLLPLVVNKNGRSPKSMDLILRFVENILSNREARNILVNRAVREGGERVIPPPSFEILVRLTFAASYARVKATETFEAIYPLLKEVALAPKSATKSNAMKQIFTFALKLAGEGNHVSSTKKKRKGNPELAEEATSIAILSVTENIDCFKQWDFLYKENLEASVALLKKLVDEWEEHSFKLSLSPSDILTLNRTMKSFSLKNRKGIAEGGANCSLYKEADKWCKVISGRLSRGSGGFILTSITAAVLAIAGAAEGALLYLFYLASCYNVLLRFLFHK